jgi:hypothetical protein
MRRFLSRAAFALIVIACALSWEAYRGGQQGTVTGVRKGLYVAGAVLCFAAGAAGMKERHRPPDDL